MTAMGILAEVIGKVGKDRVAVRDGLAAYNSPENAYKGISGPTFFDKYGDCQETGLREDGQGWQVRSRQADAVAIRD